MSLGATGHTKYCASCNTAVMTTFRVCPSCGWKEFTKRSSGNKRALWGISIRRDSVIPLAVELGALDIDCGHLGVGDDNAAGVLASVEFAAHGEAGLVVVAEIRSTITR